MKIGICGFAGAGKSTVFEALSGSASEQPGARREERIATVKVPDARVEHLATLHDSKRCVHAELRFVDAPPQSGQTGALDASLLGQLQSAEVLVLVLRDFAHPLTYEAARARQEADDFFAELILHDMQPLENRLLRLQKEGAKSAEKALLERCLAHLEGGHLLQTLPLRAPELAQLTGYGLLSGKPLLCLLNQAEQDFDGTLPAAWHASQAEGLHVMPLSAPLEREVAELDAAEQQAFLEPMGLTQSARTRFIQQTFSMLQLISFLTTGSDESRAWPVRRGSTAHKAAGKIHSDIARGFIRAEVVSYDVLIRAGNMKAARQAGQWRLEGKTYVVQDGDVINFRFNV